MPRLSVEVLEGEPKLHSNIIAPLPKKVAQRIARSPRYDGYLHVQTMTIEKRKGGMSGLTGYLLKEGTPQATYRTGVRRNKGSHALEDGGDRVRLSDELEATLLSEGRIEPYKHTYAARSRSVPSAVHSAPRAAAAAPNVIPAPVTAPPYREPQQLALAFDAPVIDIRARIEAKRLERGMTQTELAARIGIRQPQYSNAIVRRQDPLGRWARSRALEWLAAA